jgi:hypothetical protein
MVRRLILTLYSNMHRYTDMLLFSVHPQVERALHGLFKRTKCVACPGTTPSCPSCSGGKVCSLVPQSCDSCAYTTCVDSNEATPHYSGPNVGAIAGGVIGGVLVAAVAICCFYWFVIRPRRQKLEDEWEHEDQDQADDHKANFHMQRSENESVHTVQSVANSILSRASNFIPIAYIPGVMNRDGRGRHVPPVPPIPAAHGPPVRNQGPALFFRPDDLRDSTYSDDSSLDNRSTFFGRPSITPSLARSSIATYRDDAVVNPLPAQTVLRGKANVVSVKSASSSTPSSTSPNTTPSEEISNPLARHKLNVMMPTSSDNAKSSSKQTLSNASYGKPTLLTVGGTSNSTTKQKGRSPTSSPAASAPKSTKKPNTSSPLSTNTPTTVSDPFTDDKASSSSSSSQVPLEPKRTPGGLAAVMEETASLRGSLPPASKKKNNGVDVEEPSAVVRNSSPFGDEHATT